MNDPVLTSRHCSHCTSECQLTSFDVQLSAILVSPSLFLTQRIVLLDLQAPAMSAQMALTQWLEANALRHDSRKISLPADWSSNASAYIGRNYVGLQVTLSTFLVNSYTQSATLSWTDVLANVGGQTGL